MDPSKQIQAYSRILRSQQTRKPRIYMLRAKGSIDEYMQQLMDAKSEAIDEGIDYQEAAEFNPAKWLSYRDFTIKMLKEEGLMIWSNERALSGENAQKLASLGLWLLSRLGWGG